MKDSDDIENRFSFRCPKKWSEMNQTDDPGVRHCEMCNESVHLAESVDELYEHAKSSRCVALELMAVGGMVEHHAGYLILDKPMKRQDDEFRDLLKPPMLGRVIDRDSKPAPPVKNYGWQKTAMCGVLLGCLCLGAGYVLSTQ